jgi:ribA/ribD-fused uncharacterized protein
MMINSFNGKYRFLSNFYPVNGTTVEHQFQAAKAVNTEDAMKVMACKTPGEAKRMGRSIKMRPDWNRIKLKVMYELVKAKFEDPTLRRMLLDTGNEYLQEGNTWGDTFWGVRNGRGSNHLGKVLMKVRDEIRGDN